jgi:DNA repair exonuclease SbcCD ATPase subunit
MIQEYRNKLENLKGQKKQIENQIRKNKDNIITLSEEKTFSEQAQKILQIVAKETQEQIIIHISGIVSLALTTIFDEPYEFKLDFVEKRGKTEADVYFLREGQKIDPMTGSGGGVIDIASFALRIALWSLSNKRNTIIMDEPARFVSKNYIPRVAKLFKMLSEKLNLQFIIVTHINELVESADKVFQVSIEKGISKIEERI